MTMTDLGPATDRLCALIEAVPDEALGRPTPCTEYTIGDLLHHIAGVTVAFGGAAVKARGESSTMGPWGDASKLDPDWRTSLPVRLKALAEAWRDPDAWTGMTRVGGQDQAGEVTGIILLGELVVHGSDLARGAGLSFEVDSTTLAPLYDLVRQVFGPGQGPAGRGPAFGPPGAWETSRENRPTASSGSVCPARRALPYSARRPSGVVVGQGDHTGARHRQRGSYATKQFVERLAGGGQT